MGLIDTARNYHLAASTAARRGGMSYPTGVFRILSARGRLGLGPRLFSLFRLHQVDARNWSSYVIDESLRKVLRVANPPQHRELLNNKLKFHEHCVSHGIATIPVVSTISARTNASPEQSGASLGATLERFATDISNHPHLFFKLMSGTWGLHAFTAIQAAGEWSFSDRTGSASDIYRHCLDLVGGQRQWIVQPVARSHADLAAISSPTALNTIRAITYIDHQGTPRLAHAILRIAVGDTVTDNFAHGASGNLVAPIDSESGVLGRAVGSLSRTWPDIAPVERHPDTGNVIIGRPIPHWRSAKDLVLKAHATMPGMKTVGWDVAVTQDGPLIVEGNATYDVDLIQVAFDRGIKPDLDAFLTTPPINTESRS